MKAHSTADGDLPDFVSIPDPRHARGIRAYCEPEEPRPLQIAFLDVAIERAWTAEISALLCSGRAEEADARLAAELAGFHGVLATLCKATTSDQVALEGWDDLLPILAEWEGPPITAITVGLTNSRDLEFGGVPNGEPELLICLYSDEAYPFSQASKADLVSESGKDLPAWLGREEDVEFYCEVSGIAKLNAALTNCKHRHFLRDGTEERAPGGYVEYILGCWLLATRFLQAFDRAVSHSGLPARCRLIVGTVDTNADFLTVTGGEEPFAGRRKLAVSAEPHFASLIAMRQPPRVPESEPTQPDALKTFRQRFTPADPSPSPPERRGFLSRLLARYRVRRPFYRRS